MNGLAFKDEAVEACRMRQGYIASVNGRSVRVRISGGNAWLTIKGPGDPSGISRSEWEIPLSSGDAADLLGLCPGGIIDKTRYIIPAGGGRRFEVDEFHGENEGLVMAEIELGDPDEPFERPAWLGEEVTGDRRYYNSYLSAHPYGEWGA